MKVNIVRGLMVILLRMFIVVSLSVTGSDRFYGGIIEEERIELFEVADECFLVVRISKLVKSVAYVSKFKVAFS